MPNKNLLPQPSGRELEIEKDSRGMMDEIYKDAPVTENGIPIVSVDKVKEIMKKYGLRDATQPEG